MTDGELIAAARHGDTEAWRELYARWLPWVWRYAYAQVQDIHIAEDVTSEAMTAWVRNVDGTGSDAPQVAAWLRSVVRNKAADHHRKGYRQRRALEGVSAVRAQTAPDDDPSLPLRKAEARVAVNEALDLLSETHRTALEWKYAEGLSVRAIAERTGSTEKAVEANLYRARREFRRHYEAIEARHGHPARVAPIEDQPRSALSGAPRASAPDPGAQP